MPRPDGCTCYAKAETDGCTEWSCMYHGADNRRKTAELRANCPLHKPCPTCQHKTKYVGVETCITCKGEGKVPR